MSGQEIDSSPTVVGLVWWSIVVQNCLDAEISIVERGQEAMEQIYKHR